MAVTSLHTISFPGDSPRPVPRQSVAEGSQRTQSSSVLQMWRKIEDEHAGRFVDQRNKTLRQPNDEYTDDISTQTSESNSSEQRAYLEEIAGSIASSNLSGSETRAKDGNHDGEEMSSAERKRVRLIFRDWMKCGGREHSSNPTQMSGSSRAQWLGDKECERVRLVREWVQLTAQDSGSYSDKKEIAKIGAAIEMVRDGLAVDQHEGRPNRAHRKLRRLCGKQALIDLIVKAEKERQCELEDLKKHHAVSQFSHRNRIQSLLKGRFLRNNISSEKPKPRSTAAGELGLLRQRQTVSGLREGFLSRTDSSGQSQLDSVNDHASSNSSTLATCTKECSSHTEEIASKADEHNNSTKEDHDIPDLQSVRFTDSEETRLPSDGSLTVVNEHVFEDNEVNRQHGVGVESTITNSGTVPEENLQASTSKRSHRGRHHVADNTQALDPTNQGGGIHDSSSVCMNGLGAIVIKDLNLPRHATVDEATQAQHSGNEEGLPDRVACNGWRGTLNSDMGNDTLDVLGQPLDYSANDLVESVHSEGEGHHVWEASESEESVEDWLHSSPRQDSGAFSSSDTFFGMVEENVRTSELNELIGRRRVSSLLESGFRENLNRLLQTYVDRQVQSSMGWDLNDSISSSASEILHQGHQTENENEHSVHTFGPSSSSEVPPSRIRLQPIGDQVEWMHAMHQPHTFQDWEVVNDLRMDITTLQLRMNDMQRMLEACMDMQLELQRSIRQEVSAALNRSVQSGSVVSGLADDESKWELVRKGICCVCSYQNINSLLYRCGHMCTCTKCANQLLNEKSKCPMCQSPIVEVIRAYSAQQ